MKWIILLAHLKMLNEAYYTQKGMETPTIHCIGYMTDKNGDAFLKTLSNEYKGTYR